MTLLAARYYDGMHACIQSESLWHAWLSALKHGEQVAITCREMESTRYLANVRDAQLSLAMPHLLTVDAKGLELQVLLLTWEAVAGSPSKTYRS